MTSNNLLESKIRRIVRKQLNENNVNQLFDELENYNNNQLKEFLQDLSDKVTAFGLYIESSLDEEKYGKYQKIFNDMNNILTRVKFEK